MRISVKLATAIFVKVEAIKLLHYSQLYLNSIQYFQISIFHILDIRQIYSTASIGLNDYITVREKLARNSKDSFERFRQRLVALTGENEHEMVYTEDLKQMIHIAEPTEEDLQLITKMLSK